MSKSRFNQSPLKIFISYFKPHKKLFFLDMVCAFSIALIDLAFPLVSRWCLYELIPDGRWQPFWTVMVIFLLAYVLRSVFTYIVGYWGHSFGVLVEADIRKDLFTHVQSLAFDYFDHNRTGHLMSRLTSDLFDITELAHHGPEDIFISLVTIGGALAVMYAVCWQLALVITLLLPLFIVVVWHRRRKMSRVGVQVKETVAGINTEIESGISGIKTAKAFANEAKELQKFNRSNDRFKTAKRKYHHEMGVFAGLMEFFMCVLSLAVIAVGGALIMGNKLTTVDLITFSLYVTTFVNPIRKLSNFSELFVNGTAGLHRFIELMRVEPSLQDAPDAVELEQAKGQISFEDVSFSYQERHPVLHHVNLNIRPGETLALVGSSGGGKTTLSQLIPRFYDVTRGVVRVDGQDVRKLKQASLRRHVGVVQQDVFLFADTVAGNIRYGRPDATMEEVAEAAKRAEIYEDIMAMPDGFDTQVGERGVMLSGGQKQRISIARIFLKNPAILILDEATSALDSVTEARIQQTFEALSAGRTTIVIAHRLSTVRRADRIAVVEEGNIVELGRHEDLLAAQGVYSELVKAQNWDG